MVRMPDLDDRDIANVGEKINYMPRAAFDADLRLVDFEEFETEDGLEGFAAKVYCIEVQDVGRQLDEYDELPAVKDIRNPYVLSWVTKGHTGKKKFVNDKNKKAMRLFLCAVFGQKHTPEFEANKALRTLLKLADAGMLKKIQEFQIRRRCTLSKPREDEDGDVVRYVNTKDTFAPIEYE